MSIDNRVVQMEFNNAQFERGIRTSIKSLDWLKKGLNLDESARSLSNLERVGRSFSLAGIAAGVDNIANRFTTMGLIGMTAIQNLTNSAVNAGKRFIKSLTIDPIKTGLDEYETKMNAITTIMTNTQSKGTTLDQVNDALNELNKYADLTIYNFAEMTRNIGTFTAAGIGLEDSATAIKGIANLAAGSGSTAHQASTAMYQLSQALAAGSVKLMDWNSVVNAGMGGELFQNALKQTAKSMGIFIDESVPFRESLQDGWITSEVLIKTLKAFSEDEALVKAATQVKTLTQLIDTMKESVQSGWAQSWEEMIGNKEEAASLFTALNDGFSAVVGASADARNEMLSFWKANGGRAALLQGIGSALLGISSILEPIEKGFREMFPTLTGQKLVDITKGFRDLMSNFKIGEMASENITRTFRGLFALLDIGKQATFALGKALVSILKYLFPVGAGLLGVTGNIGDFIVSIRDALKSSDAFNVALSKIGKVLKPVADGIKIVVGSIVETLSLLTSMDMKGLDSFSEKVQNRFKPLTRIGDAVSSVFEKMFSVIKKVSPIFYNLASSIGNLFTTISDEIGNALNNSDFNSIFDLINSGLFAGILFGVRKFINSLTEITDSAGGFLNGITSILDGVKGSLEAYQSQLKANTLMKIAGAIAILSAALVVLSLIDSVRLTTSLAAMTAMFVQLFGSMAIFQNIMSGKGLKGIITTTIAMMGLSVAVLILSSAMTKLAKLDWESITKGLIGVAGLTATLVTASKLLSSGTVIKGAFSFIIFALAINTLSKAVQKLGDLDTSSLTKGLIGVGVLMGQIALFMRTTNLDGMGLRKGLGLLILAGALSVMASAVHKFAVLDPVELLKGLGALTLILTQLAIFMNLTGDVTKVISTAIGLTVLGAAMLIFSKAISNLGLLSIDELIKGLIGMAGSLTTVALALNIMPKNMIVTGLGLIGIATALLMISKALSNMGGMTWEEVGKGLVVLAGSLTIIAVAMKFMTTALPGAAALLIIAGALAILAPALKLLGSMSMGEIGRGLLALVGVFVVLGVAGLALAKIMPVLIALAGTVGLMGIGIAGIGAGTMLFAAGLAALAVSGGAAAVTLVAMVSGLIGLIPFLFEKLGEAVINLAKIIGGGAPILVAAIVTVTLALLEGLDALIPKIVETVLKLVTALYEKMSEYVPRMVKAGLELVKGILKGIGENISEVISLAIQIVVNYIDGITSMLPQVIQAGVDLILSFINGLADAIRDNTDAMIAAVENLIFAILEAGVKIITNNLELFLKAGRKLFGEGFLKGIEESTGSVLEVILGIIKACVQTLTGAGADFTKAGADLVSGFVSGIRNNISEASKWVTNMAESTLQSAKDALGIRSPSKLFREIGENLGDSLALGIKDNTKKPEAAAENMASKTAQAASKAGEKTAKASTKASKSAFDKSVEWINDRKYYNLLSLQEELEAWERIQTRYIKGSEERKKADKEVYRVRQQLIKEEEEAVQKAIKDSFDHSTNWIDDRKYYNRLSLKDELAAWERVQARYEKGTEQRKKADREVYRVKKEIIEKQKTIDDDYYEKTKDINDRLKQDVKSLNDEYDRALESRTNSLYNSSGLFDEFKEKQKVSGDSLIVSLNNQVLEFEKWQRNINELAEKGLPEKLMDELIKMGPRSAAQIDALNRMSEPKLQSFVDLWERKYKSANQQAREELEGLRSDTNDQIRQLKRDADQELIGVRNVWKEQMTGLTADMSDQMEQFNMEWDNTLTKLERSTIGAFENMVNGVKNVLNKTEATNISNGFVSAIISSLTNRSKNLTAETQKTVVGALTTAKKTLDAMANKEGQIDLTPTIRPVLDLTDVENGLKHFFGVQRGIGLNVSTDKALSVSRSIETRRTGTEGSSTNVTHNTDDSKIVINNYNTVRNDSDIGKISQGINNVISRFKNARGVPVHGR